MVVTKEKPDYITVDQDFKPQPKYGHYSELDPDFAQLKPGVDTLVDSMWAPQHSLQEFRSFWLNDSAAPPGCPKEGEHVITETRRIPMRDAAEVEVKIYTAKARTDHGSSSRPSALALRFHGGGWVVGGHCTEHSENLAIAGKTNTVVVSVDYRMAPEYKFPYAHNDCFDALKWAKENAHSLGADPNKIIIVGGSAGGNLASAIPILARDEGITGIVGQVLCFPVTCHPKFFPSAKYELASYRQNHNASVVSATRMEWFLDLYMPEPTPDALLSPLLTPSLKNLPPALVLVGGYDIFRDEGLAYSERLKEDGVDTEVHVYQGMPHCFYMFAEHPKTADYYQQIISFINKYSA